MKKGRDNGRFSQNLNIQRAFDLIKLCLLSSSPAEMARIIIFVLKTIAPTFNFVSWQGSKLVGLKVAIKSAIANMV